MFRHPRTIILRKASSAGRRLAGWRHGPVLMGGDTGQEPDALGGQKTGLSDGLVQNENSSKNVSRETVRETLAGDRAGQGRMEPDIQAGQGRTGQDRSGQIYPIVPKSSQAKP